ncbi:MAG: hypothetical protein HY023_14575 [Chloroflexi bacterium]|nr:hypothetical protein [Chloroflexota bacterium]
MAPQRLSRQIVLELIDQLPGEALPEVLSFIQYLHFKFEQEERAVAPSQESELLKIIHRRLPLGEQRRLAELQKKMEDDEIGEAENQELLALVERVEEQDAERAAALLELARLRRVPIDEVLSEFAPETASDGNGSSH